MNKTAIKNYAIWARVQLIESAKQRAFEFAITDGENDPNLEIINGRILSSEEKNQRAELITLIKQKGFEQAMEEAAYTWFNRFIALRFMEVNGYLPSKVRVFTDENNEFKPQILKEAMTIELDGINKDKILGLIEKQDNEELFKYLVIAQCNALSSALPGMFEQISNWTEMLFPTNLLKADSVISQMVTNIPEEDWTDQVQIIGWLYQYYNSELKDDTFAKLKKNIKISKERIPAATQLFTPDWIVRYMVENSLGRLWYEGHPGFDKSELKYYLDEAKQEPEVEEELKKIRAEYAQTKPEEIKVIDPCMGSGHILVYAFDVLMQIYTSAGWSERDAAKSILENNLFGLDIDDRAGQLAYFAVMMKARKHNRRILNGEVRPKVLSIQESNGIDINYDRLGPEKTIAQKMIKDLKDAKEYGSILNLSVKQAELDVLKKRLEDIDEMSTEGSFLAQYETAQIINSLYPLIELAEVMIKKFDVVVTNPPYMGSSGMSSKLSTYVKKNYPDSKSDLFAVLTERCEKMLEKNGYQSMITQHAWMFISSFENLRNKIMQKNIVCLAHLGVGTFEDLNSKFVQSVAFVLRNCTLHNYLSLYDRLFERQGLYEDNELKQQWLLEGSHRFYSKQESYRSIPGAPIAYWLPLHVSKVFSESRMEQYANCRIGIQTGNNDLFLRYWQEVEFNNTVTSEIKSGKTPRKKWFPYTKGGNYRKWYGNNDFLIEYENNGDAIAKYNGFKTINESSFFQHGITWGLISSGKINFRYVDDNCHVVGNAGPIAIMKDSTKEMYCLALLNSKVMDYFSRMLNPTMNLSTGTVSNYPIIEVESSIINEISGSCVILCKQDWDSFETSWNFKKHPLI